MCGGEALPEMRVSSGWKVERGIEDSDKLVEIVGLIKRNLSAR